MADTNPLRQIYAAFWDMLEARADFQALFPLEGNKIRLYDESSTTDGRGDPPEKEALAMADTPAIRVRQEGIFPNRRRDSSGADFDVRWAIEISTGTGYLNKLLDIQFCVFRCLEHWETTMGALTWNDKSFITDCRALEVLDATDNEKLNAGTPGWASVWRGQITYWLDLADMAAASP